MKSLNLDILREAVAEGRIQWRKHVLQKLAERGIQQEAVREVLLNGERVRDYTEDRPLSQRIVSGLYWRQTTPCLGRVRWNEQASVCDHRLRAVTRSF